MISYSKSSQLRKYIVCYFYYIAFYGYIANTSCLPYFMLMHQVKVYKHPQYGNKLELGVAIIQNVMSSFNCNQMRWLAWKYFIKIKFSRIIFMPYLSFNEFLKNTVIFFIRPCCVMNMLKNTVIVIQLD